jgi:hypothetical protein
MKNKIISIGQNHLFSFKNNNKLHPQKNLLAKFSMNLNYV